MPVFLSRNLVALVAAASVSTFAAVHQAGGPLEIVVLALSATTLLLASVLERFFPYRAVWNRSSGDTATDWASAATMVGVVEPLLKLLGTLSMVAVYGHSRAQGSEWLQSLPFVLQVVMVALLIELGKYWSHRLHHVFRPLWWLHAMHHSSERLYALNNLRFHPLNHVINFAVSMLPAMLLGFSSEAILAYLALSQPVLMLQHANLDLRSGWANYVFSTNELHRWHHSTECAEADANFGSAFILWDQVFGTFRYQPGKNDPAQVGLFSSTTEYPARAGYWTQLKSMFLPECCRA
ncbi:sterol desaturase family protein [Acidovorax sp. PRC11]|jgi:sterol desaturase/sphingolipid hydroxylase (fatty acid hydroxylase superfamily)|uniref:sterol desaturase family protein n=1 Tax=Comamonadaceae TaxID=80864 RepID=UPI0028820F5A|nr:sterol desaturase family protein [Acidovorax sp. PRC11]MDT0136952.1 sterol desaturase family protein [Acidovorax sp. PRC11]